MNEFFKIGVIVKPQGIKGEVKVLPLTDSTQRFRGLKEVLIDGTACKILSVKIAPDSVILAISGINDRNTAEAFRGKFLVVPRSEAVELKEGETMTEEELDEFCLKLPRYKRPRKIIFADIPRNPTGKIEKPKLRQIYGATKLIADQNMG